MHAPFPQARLLQALLQGWVLTDPSGVVDTDGITDGPGYTDIDTTATAGTFFLTKALDRSFLGDEADGGVAGFQSLAGVVEMISGWSAGDRAFVGWCKTEDPTDGSAIYEGYGMEYVNATDRLLGTSDEAPTLSFTTALTMDQTFFQAMSYASGRREFRSGAIGLASGAFASVRSNAGAGAAVQSDYAYLMVQIEQAAASAATLRLGAGFHVGAMVPTFDIAARL